MAKKKPLVVVTRRLPEVIETRMRELFDARLNLDDKPMTRSRNRRGDARRPTCWCRPSPTGSTPASDRPGRRADEADRQFRQWRRPYRRRLGAAARHHRHQHARRPDRGHRRHDHGADSLGGAAPRRGRADHSRGRWTRLVADLDARPPHHRQAARHRRHGPHRPGAGAARQRLRPVDPLSQPPPRRRRRSRKRWRRPIGNRSTRCWRGWTSSRSIARIRRRPIIFCRRAG